MNPDGVEVPLFEDMAEFDSPNKKFHGMGWWDQSLNKSQALISKLTLGWYPHGNQMMSNADTTLRICDKT